MASNTFEFTAKGPDAQTTKSGTLFERYLGKELVRSQRDIRWYHNTAFQRGNHDIVELPQAAAGEPINLGYQVRVGNRGQYFGGMRTCDFFLQPNVYLPNGLIIEAKYAKVVNVSTLGWLRSVAVDASSSWKGTPTVCVVDGPGFRSDKYSSAAWNEHIDAPLFHGYFTMKEFFTQVHLRGYSSLATPAFTN